MNVRDISFKVEAKLTRWAQRGDGGVSLGFATHPDESKAIQEAKVGRRYMLAFVEIGDDEQPLQGGGVEGGSANAPVTNRLAVRAGILCHAINFHHFLNEQYRRHLPNGCEVKSEEDAAVMLRFLCDVESRRDIKPGTAAAEKFDDILNRFAGWEADLEG